MSHAEIQFRTEGFLNPELFQGHFAAPFNLTLVFSSFFRLYLDGTFGTSVLEFDFGTQGPAFPEIISQEKHDMRQVETGMLLVLVLFYVLSLVTQVVVAVEIVAVNRFSVSADGESGGLFCLFGLFLLLRQVSAVFL